MLVSKEQDRLQTHLVLQSLSELTAALIPRHFYLVIAFTHHVSIRLNHLTGVDSLAPWRRSAQSERPNCSLRLKITSRCLTPEVLVLGETLFATLMASDVTFSVLSIIPQKIMKWYCIKHLWKVFNTATLCFILRLWNIQSKRNAFPNTILRIYTLIALFRKQCKSWYIQAVHSTTSVCLRVQAKKK